MIKSQYIIYFAICSLLVVSCKKKDTIWKTDWATPVMSDTLRLTNLFNDSTLNTTNQTSINVDLTRTLLDIDLSDLLKIPDTTITQIFRETEDLDFLSNQPNPIF